MLVYCCGVDYNIVDISPYEFAKISKQLISLALGMRNAVFIPYNRNVEPFLSVV